MLEPNTSVLVYGRTDDREWWYLAVPNTTYQGWMHTSVLSGTDELTVVPVGTPQLARTASPPETPTQTVPQEVQARYFAVSVRGPTERKKVVGEGDDQSEADGVFLIVPLRWKNTSAIARMVSGDGPGVCIVVPASVLGCESWDVSGTYDLHDYFSPQGWGTISSQQVRPGESIDGWLVFDVPENLGAPVLRVYYEFWDDIVGEIALE